MTAVAVTIRVVEPDHEDVDSMTKYAVVRLENKGRAREINHRQTTRRSMRRRGSDGDSEY